MNLPEVEYLNRKRIFITNMITKDVQSRKHRKKRINKKWMKKYGYKAVPDDTKVYVTNDAIFMTKRCFQKLKKQIDKSGNVEDFIRFQKCYEKLTRKRG